MSNSLPYVLLLAVISLGLFALLFGVLDSIVDAVVQTEAWTSGSEETMSGRNRLEAMWNFLPAAVVTGVSMSVLWASRRGR